MRLTLLAHLPGLILVALFVRVQFTFGGRSFSSAEVSRLPDLIFIFEKSHLNMPCCL